MSKNKRSERSERLCSGLINAGSENGVDVNVDRTSIGGGRWRGSDFRSVVCGPIGRQSAMSASVTVRQLADRPSVGTRPMDRRRRENFW